MYKYIRKKHIKINGKRTTAGDTRLCTGDRIDLYISDEFLKEPDSKVEKLERNIPPILPEEIAYEDDNILVIDKKQGETVHSALPDEESEKLGEVYLIDRICAYLYQKGDYNPKMENSFAPALCNRLDRNTGGLILAAKNAPSLRILNQKMKDREIKKTYLCAVSGVPEESEATLKGYLYKDRDQNKVFVFSTKQEAKKFLHIKYENDIKTIVTKYKTLSTSDTASLLEVELITGRTHQIRAHLAYIGHPILDDAKYGISHKKKNYQALCSYRLTFDFITDSEGLEYLKGKTITSNGAQLIKDRLKQG